jgi:hypothetical protein
MVDPSHSLAYYQESSWASAHPFHVILASLGVWLALAFLDDPWGPVKLAIHLVKWLCYGPLSTNPCKYPARPPRSPRP